MRKSKLLISAIMCAAVCAAGALVACTQTHTHTIEFAEAVSATCEEQGVAGHYKCTGCDKLFADATGETEITEADIEKKEPLGHTGGDATCSAQAICIRCEQPYGEFGEHDFDGGWAMDGEFHWIGCADCGEIAPGEQKIAHTYNKKVVADKFIKSPANCRNGIEYYMTCECGAFDENAESGFYFGKSDPDAHDLGQCYDETQHWYGCRTAGCDRAKERVAAHDIASTYTKTETGHYRACSGCDMHSDEGEHAYSQHAETEAFVITAPNCQRKGTYHVSCVCGDFETDGETFETASVGKHEWKYTVTETRHSATCPNCSETIAEENHDFNATAKLKNENKVYNEDDIITIADLEIVGKCECGKEATASGSIGNTFSYTVTGADNEKFTVAIDGDNAEISIKSRKLARWNIELVGATAGGSTSFQAKANNTIGALVPTAGKTFAGFYYDEDLNVYSVNALPVDYTDANLTAYDIGTYKLPDNAESATKSLKLTAMFLEDMPHFAPSDYMAADMNNGNVNKKVGEHVALNGGIVATKFDWGVDDKGYTYKVRSAKDTGTHAVNVTAPAYGKSIMIVYIVNYGNTDATVKYQTENWGIKGEMTVTVGANSTVAVPFAYGIGDGSGYQTFPASDHCITVTNDIDTASLGFYGHILVDGKLKATGFELTSGVEYETGKAISIDGKLKVGANDYAIDVYGVNTDLPDGAKIEDGYHHVKLDAFGLDDELTIYKKDEHSGWNRFMLAAGKIGCQNGLPSSTKAEVVTVDGIKAAKYSFPDGASSGNRIQVQTNSTAPTSDINVRIPLYSEEAREIEFYIINYGSDEFKININPENESKGTEITVAGEQAGIVQKFNVTWPAGSGNTCGGWIHIDIKSDIPAGSSFAVYGYWKASNIDLQGGRNKAGIDFAAAATKISFSVGEKFSSSGLQVRFNTGNNSVTDQPRIINYVTDYDDYTFTADDIGTHTVTVYWAGLTATYNITVTA